MDVDGINQRVSAYLAFFDKVSILYKTVIRDPDGRGVWREFAVDDVEQSDECEDLVRYVCGLLDRPRPWVMRRLLTFMKRSGAYFSPRDDRQIAEQLIAHLQGTGQVRKTHLVSLPWVSMDLDVDIAGNGFLLKRLEPQQICDLMENHIRTAFYPTTALSELDIQRRAYEPWLIVHEYEDRLKPGTIKLDFSVLGGRISYTSFTEATEAALGSVLLLDWQLPEKWSGARSAWFPGHPVGLHITIDDEWFSEPSPVRRGKPGWVPDDGLPTSLGVKFACKDMEALPSIHEKMTTLTGHNENEFLTKRAIRFYVKACLVDAYEDSPARMDQVLWLAAAMDALADDGPGGTPRMANRIARITGCSVDKVRSFYKYRTDIIHGHEIRRIPPDIVWNGLDIVRTALRRALDTLYGALERGAPMERVAFLQSLDSG
jgi:hypothetical protein